LSDLCHDTSTLPQSDENSCSLDEVTQTFDEDMKNLIYEFSSCNEDSDNERVSLF